MRCSLCPWSSLVSSVLTSTPYKRRTCSSHLSFSLYSLSLVSLASIDCSSPPLYLTPGGSYTPFNHATLRCLTLNLIVGRVPLAPIRYLSISLPRLVPSSSSVLPSIFDMHRSAYMKEDGDINKNMASSPASNCHLGLFREQPCRGCGHFPRLYHDLPTSGILSHAPRPQDEGREAGREGRMEAGAQERAEGVKIAGRGTRRPCTRAQNQGAEHSQGDAPQQGACTGPPAGRAADGVRPDDAVPQRSVDREARAAFQLVRWLSPPYVHVHRAYACSSSRYDKIKN